MQCRDIMVLVHGVMVKVLGRGEGDSNELLGVRGWRVRVEGVVAVGADNRHRVEKHEISRRIKPFSSSFTTSVWSDNMSAPMDTELTTYENGTGSQHSLPEDKVLVPVEVTLKPSSTAKIEDVRSAVEGMLEKRSLSYIDGPIPVPLDEAFLADNVQRICVCGCDTGVDPFLVSWNRYPQSQLIEVNAHSLFSKWFSESGKLVAKLFQKIQEMVEEESNLVFVLIDEVESLAAARKAALSGSEPSDSIRVVNALLTQMDKLKSSPNVIILTTSNITAAIDIAFVDRADIKAYVGPPTLQARYEILRSCLQELIRTGILTNLQDCKNVMLPNYACAKERLNAPDLQEDSTFMQLCKHLLDTAEACEGMSGRSLRKLPFLAHAALSNPFDCNHIKFLCTMVETAKRERSELPD
ncbi:Pachytene checkpoint protein [Vigna angularis]|uniref:Pachytene checkpoint protein 2 homolog n=1 Tax=Phaseolus angularis TaxID=3914 RepID=A0A8T0KGW4_PHAAN|nr:Pachytene checkpoint protein [Vigna angularis]